MSILTLPATRRQLRMLFERWPAILRVLAGVGLWVATWPQVLLRGIADDTGMPRTTFVLPIERAIGFGETPTERLQDWFYTGGLSAFDWSMLLLHIAWFFVPVVISIYVLVFRWELFGQLATVGLGVLYAGLIGFFLFPTEPPWMAIDIVRLVDIRVAQLGQVVSVDVNPVAALPSLHVALSSVLAMWLWQVKMSRWAVVITVYAALTAFAVVYLGEHYVVDVVAGVLLAFAVVRISRYCWSLRTTPRTLPTPEPPVPR